MIKSIKQAIDYMKEQYSERVSFQWYSDEKHELISKTFTEFHLDVYKAATYYSLAINHISGKHIGMIAASSYDYVVTCFAILLSGGVFIPLNMGERLSLLQEQIDFADISALIIDETCKEMLPALSTAFQGDIFSIASYLEVENVIEIPEKLSSDENSMMIYTSGTTGKNKLVMITMANVLAMLEQNVGVIQDVEKTFDYKINSFFNCLPMYHVFGLTHVLKMPYAGVTVNLCNQIRNVYRDLKLMKSDYVIAVPILLQNWHDDLKRGKKERLGGLKILGCGGAAMDPDFFPPFLENEIILLYGYSLTENLGVGILHYYPATEKRASVGKVQIDCEIKIDSDEICLRSPLSTKGYYKNPEDTASLIDEEGWLHTGDLGYIDDEGYVFITGRKKNLIILASGENVSPEELEKIVSQNESIKELLIKEKNRKICAEIFCEVSVQDTVRSFISEINRTLPMYKRITLVEFRDVPFDRTETGKIKRNS